MKRYWVFRTIGMVAALMTVVAVVQSPCSSADGVFLLTSGGRLLVLGWHRGNCAFYTQQVRTGSFLQESSMIQTFSVDPAHYLNWWWYGGPFSTLNLGAARATVGWKSPDYGDSKWLMSAGIVVPLWTWLTVALPLPAAALIRLLRTRRRRLHGLCTVCGYDLRASPSRCPECGAIQSSNMRARALGSPQE